MCKCNKRERGRAQLFKEWHSPGHNINWLESIGTKMADWSSNTLAPWCKELTHWKDPDAGQDWRQEEKGTTDDEMVGWHHWLNGHEFEQALGDSEGKGSLGCCSPWDCKESDMTELKIADKTRPWSSIQQVKWHTQRCHDSSKALLKD